MPRRPAIVTQADIARAIRAAKQAGATGVEVKPDGTMLIRLDDLPTASPSSPTSIQAPLQSEKGEVLF
jgi:hypothetical protein